MKIGLGIDAGGTYTDSVLVDLASGTVLSSAKAFTTRYDYTVGIEGSISQLNPELLSRVQLTSLSTTLATNAIVEGQGGDVCLILIGYDRYPPGHLPEVAAEFVGGGHNVHGEEVSPLDEEALRRAILKHRDTVQAFAVAGYFSVRNPEHELRARDLIVTLSELPVVCGHELSMALDSRKRAVTAALNARLIPIIQDLLASVKAVLGARRVEAPLMVVKGDGSLVTEAQVTEKPIETILSGPAASVIGGKLLTDAPDAVVVDIGGTTTDIAVLEGGHPRLNEEGATVGEWRTSVRAVDIQTCGLGGDSRLSMDLDGNLHVGPRRVVPLAFGPEGPHLTDELKRIARLKPSALRVEPTDFFSLARDPGSLALSSMEARTVKLLERQPLSLLELAGRLDVFPSLLEVSRLERLGLVQRMGLTPTDVLHAEGSFTAGDAERSSLGVQIFARRMNLSIEELFSLVKYSITRKMGLEITSKIIAERFRVFPGLPGCEVCGYFSHLWFAGRNGQKNMAAAGPLGSRLTLEVPVIAIGAPAGAYVPPVAESFGTRCVLPEHAAVANAIGAVSGAITTRTEVLIRPVVEGGYALHSPLGRSVFADLDSAITAAREQAENHSRAQAEGMGAGDIEVELKEEGSWGRVHGDDAIFLSHTVCAVAVGRPQLVRE